MIVINCRNLNNTISGVQRYTREMISRMPADHRIIKPEKLTEGLKGHLWEQFILPHKAHGHLLWSPSNTGPVFYRNQVVTLHDLAVFDHPTWFSPKFSKAYHWIIPRLVSNVRAIITDSQYSKERLINFFPACYDKVHTIPLAAHQNFIPQSLEIINKTNATLKLPSNRYILTVSSIEPRKNIHTLLAAWKQLLPHIDDDIYLVIVGGFGKRTVFAHSELNDIPDRVFFVGHVADEFLPALYSGAIAFIYISLYEGFGLPILEAMSCKTPVITSNTTSIPEVTGNTGILVDPEDIDEIVHNLQQIITNKMLRDSLVEKAYLQSRNFSWDKTAKSTWDILSRYSS